MTQPRPPKPGSIRTRTRLVVIELMTMEAVETHWKQHLMHGGAFGPPGGKLQGLVSLLLVGPAATPIEVPAKTVYCGAEGTGYELIGFNASLKKQLEAWVLENTAPDAHERAPTTKMPKLSRVAPAAPARPAPDPPTERSTPLFPSEPAPESGPPIELPCDTETGDEDERIPLNVFERMRALTSAQQLKVAREGELNERVALERMLGKAVWEAVLRNPKVTPREVARIARMGTAPVPLLETIASNGAWSRAPEVRRALLSNQRLTGDLIARVLRLLPKHELRLVPLQTAYPPPVRDAARRMLPKV